MRPSVEAGERAARTLQAADEGEAAALLRDVPHLLSTETADQLRALVQGASERRTRDQSRETMGDFLERQRREKVSLEEERRAEWEALPPLVQTLAAIGHERGDDVGRVLLHLARALVDHAAGQLAPPPVPRGFRLGDLQPSRGA